MKRFALFLFLLLSYAPAAHAVDLYIYCASSMATALEKIAKDYPKDRVYVVSAATSALAWQIMHGARADIFITAHPIWLAKVRPLKTTMLASNRLTLVAKRGASLDLADFAPDQASATFDTVFSGKRIALGDTSVPIGLYTKQALRYHRLWTSAQKFAVFGQNAHVVLSWVKRGNVAAAVIYASDLHAHPKLTPIMQFAPESHEPIIYQMGLVSSSQESEALWLFLNSQQTRVVLKNRGFEIRK